MLISRSFFGELNLAQTQSTPPAFIIIAFIIIYAHISSLTEQQQQRQNKNTNANLRLVDVQRIVPVSYMPDHQQILSGVRKL